MTLHQRRGVVSHHLVESCFVEVFGNIDLQWVTIIIDFLYEMPEPIIFGNIQDVNAAKIGLENNFIKDTWKDFTMADTSLIFPSDGVITAWCFYALTSADIHFHVFRWHHEGGYYYLVGDSFVKGKVWRKLHTETLTPNTCIEIRKGDILGWTFTGRPAFGFKCGGNAVRWVSVPGNGPPRIGKRCDFPQYDHANGGRTYLMYCLWCPIDMLEES